MRALALALSVACRPPLGGAPLGGPPVSEIPDGGTAGVGRAGAEAGPDLIYLVMVDRFADGDPALPGAVDRGDPQGWHGGDLAGLAARLDHLQALGVRTVWVTPIWAARDEKIDQWGAFHGYWVQDPSALQPRFGDAAALRALSDALHARGMRLVIDVVWNHLDPDAPRVRAEPGWFHATGDVVDWDDPVQRVTGRVHGLPDLAQERPEVRAWLAEVTAAGLRLSGADGLRVDAVGHMPLDAQAALLAQLRAGQPGLWAVGEDFSGDPARLARSLREGGFDAVFDFPLHYAMIDVFCNGADPLGRLGGTLSLDRLYPEGSGLVTFLDNHDLPRLLAACGGDRARADEALLFLYANRGTPSITWGTEAGLDGAHEPENRASMPWDAVGHRGPLLGELAAARAHHPALRAGSTALLDPAGAPGLDLLRASGAEAAWIRVNPYSSPAAGPGGDPGGALPAGWTGRVRRVGRLQVDGGRLVRAAADPGPLHARPPAPPGLVIELLEAVGDAPWGGPPPPWVELEVEVRGAPEGPLVLVGAGPELGHWRPAAGVPVVDGRARLRLPEGSVAVLKPVWRGPGDELWAPGPDRALRVRPGPATVDWNITYEAPR